MAQHRPVSVRETLTVRRVGAYPSALAVILRHQLL
jgi:hypothetical protein